MSKKEKLLKELMEKPKDFTYEKAKTLLEHFGFKEYNKGKTSGSRIKLENKQLNIKIELHKPHPGNVLKDYQVLQLIKKIERWNI